MKSIVGKVPTLFPEYYLKTAQKAIASNWIEAYKKYASPEIHPARGLLRQRFRNLR